MNENGYLELTHTADWALKVWGRDLPELFTTAAKGMYELLQLAVDEEPRQERRFQISAYDSESLLVGFLSELLVILELEEFMFNQISVTFNENELEAVCSGIPVVAQAKEIKAVTYNELEIKSSALGIETIIVFDV
jgi:SHS2 domain-containing protein